MPRAVLFCLPPIDRGFDVQGYYLWSCFDNFEWVFGSPRRFDLVYIDSETQERTWKGSAYTYREYIAQNGFPKPD